MVSVPQSSWVCYLRPTKSCFPSTATNPRLCTVKASLKVSSSSNAESSSPDSSNSQEKSPETLPVEADSVEIAFAKAQEYKKSNPTPKVDRNSVSESSEMAKKIDGSDSGIKNGGSQERTAAVKLAMEKAKEYKQNKGAADSSKSVVKNETISGLKEGNGGNLRNGFVQKKVGKKEEPTISGIDFMGLNFSDKKTSRGLPAGLVPVSDPFPEGDLPEVEIIVGDTSKFGDVTLSKPQPIQEDGSDLYKPRVSTWGVFPRPSNISKTYGGGRVIRPGEMLETVEDKAAKEARTRQLLAAYKSKSGLNIDAKLKSECEKALRDGDSLMDIGKLSEALPYYEKVMDKLAFQSELHGLAALQWSICQDSLSCPNEAQVMYEKLQSHPNVQVSKKARQFMFGFQAMEMMKVTSSSLSAKDTGYQDYFEAFIEDKSNYPLKEAEAEAEAKAEESAMSQALPYILFLVSPIFIVLFIAVRKGI